MLAAIAHRGPDDEGIYVNGRIGIGNCRLSIIDLSGGHQPICNEEETVWVVCNGEIYNYRRLRQELVRQGHLFRSNSDTEVIVHLYEEHGERCVERLSGMFAFAVWDEREQKLVLARDRIGQKPLFYAQAGKDLLFASEVKAILTSWRSREIDYEALHHYLSLRFIPAPHTMLRYIKKLPPAHLLVYQDGKVSLSRYWELSFREKLNLSEAGFVQALREKLAQAIDAHLVSDVPVGAFLSGGMDSSMIVAMMARNLTAPFKTFAIGVKNQSYNELPFARMVADRYQTRHFEQCVEFDLVRSLPRLIWHLDEPSDPIAACQFQAAKLAAPHVKVVLGGDGGDELFAGFDRYLGVNYIDYYALIPPLIRRKVIGPLVDQVRDSFNYKSITQKLRWAHRLSMVSGKGERYAEATCFFRFDHRDKQSLFSEALWTRLGHLNSAHIIVDQFDNAKAEDAIDRMLYADLMTRLPEHSLMLTDRMTMAHGLEARSPYLDHELVEFLAAFPSKMKIRRTKLKYVLRQLAVDYLPEQIVKREKQGFMFPVAHWFRGELYPFVERSLLDSYFVREGIFRQDMVVRMLEEHRRNQVDHHVRLWMLLNLELWHQMYVEQDDVTRAEQKVQRYLGLGRIGYRQDAGRASDGDKRDLGR
jgi:asparagine synthase (glutamine-hydrolysing)